MPPLTEFARHRDELKRQLLRRVGYTGGLFHLDRFARVIAELEPLLPAGPASLEKATALAISGKNRSKYARDMLDVLKALRLLDHSGPRMTLSARGRAMFALHSLGKTDAVRPLLLTIIMDVDGDYALNILDMIASEPDAQAQRLFERVLVLLSARRDELNEAVHDTVTRGILSGWLDQLEESTRRILGAGPSEPKSFRERIELQQKARAKRLGVNKSASRTPRPPGEASDTVRHTVTPRRGWLQELGLARLTASPNLTEEGARCHRALEDFGFRSNQVMSTPYSVTIADELSLSVRTISNDSLVEIAARTYGGSAKVPVLSVQQFVEEGSELHQWTRLRNFNQSQSEAIYVAMASSRALRGEVLKVQQFQELLNRAALEMPERIYRLSERKKGLGYVVFR